MKLTERENVAKSEKTRERECIEKFGKFGINKSKTQLRLKSSEISALIMIIISKALDGNSAAFLFPHSSFVCVCVCLRKKVLDIKANLNSLALQ